MKPDTLADYRAEIDALDTEIVALIAQRFGIASRVAELKRTEGLPVRMPERINEVLDRVADLAMQKGTEPEAIRAIYTTVIETTCLFEEARITKSA